MDDARNALKAWLQRALTQTGETPSTLARRAGLSASTLTRFLGQDDGPLLSTRTLGKIAHVTGIQPPGTTLAAHGGTVAGNGGFSEPDAQPYTAPATDDEPLAAAIQRLLAGRNSANA